MESYQKFVFNNQLTKAEMPLGQKSQQEMNRRLSRKFKIPAGDKAESRRFRFFFQNGLNLDIFSIEYAFSVDITRFFDALNHTSVNISRFFDALNHISVNISRFFDAQVKNQSISISFCNHNILIINISTTFG